MTTSSVSAAAKPPRYRWWLTITCSKNSHYLLRTVIVAAHQADAEREAIQETRRRRLTSDNGVPWDRWTLLERGAGGSPLHICAIGDLDMVTWSSLTAPARGFGYGTR